MAVLNSRPPRERSAIAQLATDPREAPGLIIWADCRLTRRKRHHIITDEAENVLFRSRWLSDILEWLANDSCVSYVIVTDRDRYRATSGREQEERT